MGIVLSAVGYLLTGVALALSRQSSPVSDSTLRVNFRVWRGEEKYSRLWLIRLDIETIQTHKTFKITLFIRTKTQSANFRGYPLCQARKMTLKQQLNGEQ